MWRLAFVALLLVGCSYKSITLSLPSLKRESLLDVFIKEKPQPPLGYIVVKERKSFIYIDGDITDFIKAKLQALKNPKLKHFTMQVSIKKLRIVYFPKRANINLYGTLQLEVKLLSKKSLYIKNISINRALYALPVGYEKRIKSMLLSMIDEMVHIVEGIV